MACNRLREGKNKGTFCVLHHRSDRLAIMGGRILVGKKKGNGEMIKKAMQNEKNEKKRNLTTKFIASSQNRK